MLGNFFGAVLQNENDVVFFVFFLLLLRTVLLQNVALNDFKLCALNGIDVFLQRVLRFRNDFI